MGSKGGKYSKRKYLRGLTRLAHEHPDKFTLTAATKEVYKINWSSGDPRRPYPVAANGSTINRHIAEQLGKLLERHGVCTQEEFIEMIK